MLKTKGVCDVCKVEFDLSDSAFSVETLKTCDDGITFVVRRLNEPQTIPNPSFTHVCGKHCLHRYFDTVLGMGGE